MLFNDKIFKTLLEDSGQFYRRSVRNLEKSGERSSQVQSWALKECCYDYLVTMIDLFQKLYIRKEKRMLVEFEDFKSVLA